MKDKAVLVARYLLGLIYFVFGLNGFLQFIPQPPDLPQGAVDLSMALFKTGYFFPLLKGTEVICGLLLLVGKFNPLALVILAPITIQIFFFHLVLTPGPQFVVLPILMIVLHVTAARKHWGIYSQLLKA